MIHSYKACMAGPYHLKNDIPCQDAFAVMQQDGWTIAAVADGLGSMPCSDIGSSIAAETAVSFCCEQLAAEADIEKIIHNAFVEAYKAICEEAENNDDPEKNPYGIYGYDTTLCLAAYDGDALYYGQSGDSGMIAMLDDGSVIKVTEQQRDEDNRVFPLRFGPSVWQFGKVEKAAAVMLMTDGVLEQLCHPLLKDEEISIDIPLACLFMAQHGNDAEAVEKLEADACRFLETYPEEKLDDDKTVVVLWNSEKEPAVREEAYYAPPDWDALKRRQQESLYGSPAAEAEDEEEEEKEENPVVDVQDVPEEEEKDPKESAG